MRPDISEISKIAIDSIKLVGRHYYLYFIPLIFFAIGLIVFPIIGIMGLSLIVSIGSAALLGASSDNEVAIVIIIAAGFALFFIITLVGIFFSGYVGGMGQMLKRLLATNRISIAEYTSGMFRHAARLQFGFGFFLILFALPFLWGVERLLDMYSIYNFATMDSGWNYNLRESIGNAHSGTVFWTYIIQFVVAWILSLWWVVSISENLSFFRSAKKSILFIFRNFADSFVVITASAVTVFVVTYIFSWLFDAMGLTYEFGAVLGLYLLLPILFIVLLQFYNPKYIPSNRIVENDIGESGVEEIEKEQLVKKIDEPKIELDLDGQF